MIRNIITATLLSVMVFWTFPGCQKGSINPNIPNVVINITIDPNSTIFQELNTPGGWLYLGEESGVYVPYGSQGIIVYRLSLYDFKAYERQSPETKFPCCDENFRNCAKLIVGANYPFIKDTCNGNLYQMLDGSLFEGEGIYPLIEYGAMYEGGLLRIFN